MVLWIIFDVISAFFLGFGVATLVIGWNNISRLGISRNILCCVNLILSIFAFTSEMIEGSIPLSLVVSEIILSVIILVMLSVDIKER